MDVFIIISRLFRALCGGMLAAENFDCNVKDGEYIFTFIKDDVRLRMIMTGDEFTDLLFMNAHSTSHWIPKKKGDHKWYLFSENIGEHVGHFYRVPLDGEGPLSREDIQNIMLGEGIDCQKTHCTHEYDCCGHWYCSGVSIVAEYSKFAIVLVSWYLNV